MRGLRLQVRQPAHPPCAGAWEAHDATSTRNSSVGRKIDVSLVHRLTLFSPPRAGSSKCPKRDGRHHPFLKLGQNREQETRANLTQSRPTTVPLFPARHRPVWPSRGSREGSCYLVPRASLCLVRPLVEAKLPCASCQLWPVPWSCSDFGGAASGSSSSSLHPLPLHCAIS